MNLKGGFSRFRHWLADSIAILGLPRDLWNLVPPDVHQQATSLYKMPEKPGFLGGYNGRGAVVGVLGLLLANVLATQLVAWMFSYQRALGQPVFRLGKSFALYAPWSWIAWVFRHSAAEDPRTRFTVLLGPLMLCICLVFCFGIVYYLNLRRTRKLSQNTDEIHGSARWANARDMAEAGVLGQTEGVYIGGWYDQKNERLNYLRHDGPEHVLVFAPTRSGKGVSLVIPTILAWGESAVIYDIKGENWAKTAGHRAQTGHLCLQFAPCDETGRTTRFNPLAEIRVGTMRDVSDAQNIADILVKNLDNKPNDTHWIDTASIIVMGTLLHICYVAAGEGREANLADLASHFAIYGQNFRDTLKIMAATEHDKHGKFGWILADGRPTRVHPTVLECVQKMLDKADREFSSVVSTINTALAIYADPLVRRNTAASDFTVDNLVNFERPVSLYIVVPPSDRLRLSPLLRLVFTLIVNRLTYRMAFTPGGAAEEAAATEREGDANPNALGQPALEQVRNRFRLLMMIDEFPTLKRMELFADALSYMGGYGIKAYLIAQDLQQIYDSYGVHESIVSNCHVRVAFAPNKIETARLLSEMTGKITVEKASFTFSGSRVSPVLDHMSSSVQQIERALMTADEVMRLRPARKSGNGRDEQITHPGEMLIFISGSRPVLGTQMLYFKDPVMLKLSRIAPPLHLQAIEDGHAVQQRPLHLARHIVSRQERELPAEREVASAGSLQPAPPSPDFHVMHLANQDPRYVQPVGPPIRPKPSSTTEASGPEAALENDNEPELESH
jgi:type IV secretion system protein VirD4